MSLPARRATATAALLLLALLVAWQAKRRSFSQLAWPDECIYLVGARNLVERGSLDTHYYLTHSLLARGHPHRDVHMPGYVLALTPAVAALGTTLQAGALLNVALFLAATLLVRAIARRLTGSEPAAFGTAALFTVLPPFPGYLMIVYPELLAGTPFLAQLAWLLRGPAGTRHAFVAGVLFGIGPLVRETLLLALPLPLLRLPARELLRGFLPGCLLALALVVSPLAGGRAVHPNAIYPSVVEEALRSSEPLARFGRALAANLATNLEALWTLDPIARAEDATLGFLFLLALGAGLAWRVLGRENRRLLLATLASFGLVLVASLVLYVIRERGGVWGGVRAFMFLAPLLLALLVAALWRLPRPGRRAAALCAFGLAVSGSTDGSCASSHATKAPITRTRAGTRATWRATWTASRRAACWAGSSSTAWSAGRSR
ncbi:MAG: hypothetical protein AB7O37_07225 [Vicinamibacteria bacterium]